MWHQRLGHKNHNSLSKRTKKEIVNGLPKLDNFDITICGPCQQDKQIRVPHQQTSKILTSKPLELLHMDLMGQSRTESLGGKRYILVAVDDFSHFTWIELMRDKTEVFSLVISLCKKLRNEKGFYVSRIRSDHGKEFENSNLENFCLEKGI